MELGKGYVLPEAGALIGGRFRVARVVGSGGIAAVLEAADEQAQGARVAIKLLKPHVVDDASQRVRFQREADAMARLKHPNIVEIIFNGFSDPEYPFLAMEYLDRGSLGGQIDERRSFSPAEAALMIHGVLQGLDYAHSHGVVHRDLKPDNILMSNHDVPKIADFGFARVLDLKMSLTPSGETVGTPMYMAPEQFRGIQVDGRCDLYALGLIAFELITGSRPFPEGSYMQIATMHISTELPKVRQFMPDTPQWLVDFIETCCEKEPEHRYKTAKQALKELTSAMTRAGILQSGVEPEQPKGFFSRLFGR